MAMPKVMKSDMEQARLPKDFANLYEAFIRFLSNVYVFYAHLYNYVVDYIGGIPEYTIHM